MEGVKLVVSVQANARGRLLCNACRRGLSNEWFRAHAGKYGFAPPLLTYDSQTLWRDT